MTGTRLLLLAVFTSISVLGAGAGAPENDSVQTLAVRDPAVIRSAGQDATPTRAAARRRPAGRGRSGPGRERPADTGATGVRQSLRRRPPDQGRDEAQGPPPPEVARLHPAR